MINIQIQTKIQDKEVEVAQMIDIPENTSNKEIIILIHQLRCIVKYLEDDLYKQWEDGIKNE